MTLRDIVDRLADMVDLEIIEDDCGNWAGTYTDKSHICAYRNCEVEKIDTAEDGTLIITVDGNTEE